MTLAPDRVRSVSLMREAAAETSSLEGRVGSHVAQRRFRIDKKDAAGWLPSRPNFCNSLVQALRAPRCQASRA